MSHSEEMLCKDNASLNSLQLLPVKRMKLYSKLDTQSKLLVIHALDSGQSKSDVAKKYNLTLRTIGTIYKQKEHLLQKYSTINNAIAGEHNNFNQTLLEWFLLESKCGNYINEYVLRQKALEIINTMGADSMSIDDWLQEFRIKHKINEFSADIKCNIESKDEWTRLLSYFNSSDVYFGGMFSLSYNLDIENYLNGQTSDDYVSIMFAVNSSGTDKQQLAVTGKDMSAINAAVKSLPVKYYLCHDSHPQLNYFILNDYLENWDRVLNDVGKNILLIVNFPDNILNKFKLENIKLLDTRNLLFVTHVLDKITECIKFKYRTLQISHRIENNDCYESQLSDYIYMFAMAWHNVPSRYIELLCSPQADGGLYLDVNDEHYGEHSLSHWYKMKNMLFDIKLESLNLLDKYIYCDSKLQCVNWRDDVPSSSSNSLLAESSESSSSLEAFMAMRRLVSYLCEKNAGSVLKHAKYLENHIEYRALSQMQAMYK